LQELYVYLNDDKSFDYALVAYVLSLAGLVFTKYVLNIYRIRMSSLFC